MIIEVPGLGYAQARMQARHGQRPTPAMWEALAATAAYRAYLEQARAAGLRPWLHNLSAISPPHDIDRLLRAALCARIEEVARWLPRRWRAAVHWTAVLADVPALAHLLGGGESCDWMREDPVLQALAAAERGERAALLARGPLAPLARTGGSFVERWFAEWTARLPPLSVTDRAGVGRLVARLRLDLTEAPPPADDARLETWLTLEFHRHAPGPVAVCCHLLLLGLDFVRLRGALMERRLFAVVPAVGESGP